MHTHRNPRKESTLACLQQSNEMLKNPQNTVSQSCAGIGLPDQSTGGSLRNHGLNDLNGRSCDMWPITSRLVQHGYLRSTGTFLRCKRIICTIDCHRLASHCNGSPRVQCAGSLSWVQKRHFPEHLCKGDAFMGIFGCRSTSKTILNAIPSASRIARSLTNQLSLLIQKERFREPISAKNPFVPWCP